MKPYVLRYWEQEFTQLKPMKRRGNRRYYQHHEVLLIRRIRDLLYEQGFTISGARNRLADSVATAASRGQTDADRDAGASAPAERRRRRRLHAAARRVHRTRPSSITAGDIRGELIAIRALLAP